MVKLFYCQVFHYYYYIVIVGHSDYGKTILLSGISQLLLHCDRRTI